MMMSITRLTSASNLYVSPPLASAVSVLEREVMSVRGKGENAVIGVVAFCRLCRGLNAGGNRWNPDAIDMVDMVDRMSESLIVVN